jgi:hypothetical protein
MDKLCCCAEPELPDFTLNITCACCKSRVQRRKGQDEIDFDTVKEIAKEEIAKEEEEESIAKEEKIAKEEEEESICCCFRRKHHAKRNKDKT